MKSNRKPQKRDLDEPGGLFSKLTWVGIIAFAVLVIALVFQAFRAGDETVVQPREKVIEQQATEASGRAPAATDEQEGSGEKD